MAVSTRIWHARGPLPLALKSRRIADLDAAQIAAQPAAARPYLTALRAHYDDVMRAQTRAQPGHVTDVLTFASRAWRRPLTAGEKAGLRAFYQKSRTTNGLDHDDAIRAVLARILVSPAFLYRVETVASSREKPLNGWEMASRMSFFLWSSIPDDELRRAAAAGELSDPAQVARQVKRMTADPKARRSPPSSSGSGSASTTSISIAASTPRASPSSPTRSGRRCTTKPSRPSSTWSAKPPVKEILHADYAFLNKPLAKFYGIDRDVAV